MATNAAAWGTTMALRGLLLPFLLFFSLGAFAKSAQFPFHEWLVTAMTGPTPVSALIHAATMVKAGVFFMLRFMPIFFIVFELLNASMPSSASNVTIFFTLVVYIGAFTAFLMATQAIVARELKLILAFSTASQLGFMFAAAGAAGLIPNFTSGFIAAFDQLLSHAIFKAALFLAAGAVIHGVGSRFIDDMGGLSKYLKYTFVAMLISALSLAGLPPLLGFWTKDSVIESVYQTGLVIPIALLVTTVAITAFYSTRMIYRVFQTQPSENVTQLSENHKLHKTSKTMLVPYFILAAATVVLGVFWVFIGGDFYSALTRSVIGLTNIPATFQVTLDPLTTGISLAMLAVGLGLAYLLYGKPNYQTAVAKQLSFNGRFKAVHDFLYDRWYIQAVYYKVFVNGGTKLYQGAFKFFETGGIDRFYNYATVSFALWLSNSFRKIQSGKINHYLLSLVIGFVILLIIFLWGVL
jgi:NADH-quinone oxidoreductase subunit L